jgi:O-antigen/teichoic acid export membrane protein
MVYVFKNMSFLSGGQFLNSLVTLVFAIFIANIFPKEGYGNYKYILSTVALVNSLALTGLGPALVRAFSKGCDGTLKQFAKINFFWAFLPATILTALSVYYYVKGNMLLSVGILVGGLTLPFIERSALHTSVLNGKKLFKKLSLFSFLRNAIPTLMVAITAYFTLNPLYMAVVYFLSTSIVLNILYYHTVAVHIENNKVDEEALHLAKHTSVINIFSLISDQIDNVIIFQGLGGTALAIYNFAEAIPNVIQGFVKQVGVIAVPKFVNQDVKTARETVFRKTLVLFLASLPVALLYIVCAPYIFKILFPNYIDSVFLSQIMILGILISSSITIAFLDSQKAIRAKYILSIVSNVAKIPILILGFYWYGVMGIVIGKLVAKMIGLCTSLILVKQV